MKVISGSLKGRNILGYSIQGTRPTMDRVKESVFAMIQDHIQNSIWNKYLKEQEKTTINTKSNNKNSFNEVINMVKNMDVDKVQEGITSLQKALSLFGDLVVSKNNPTSSNNNYTPRPVYKRFED